MSRALGGLALVVALSAGCVGFAGAAENPRPRAGLWAVSPGFAWGLTSPDDLNERIQLDNLLLATAVPDFEHYKRASLSARRGLSEAISLELEFGYLWETVRDGVVTREIDVLPLTLAVAYYPPWQPWFSWNVSAGGGLLLDARASGEDPLGGFSGSGGGYTLQGALELERYVSQNWSLRARGTVHWSEVSDVPEAGETLDLSGGDIQIGVRVYAR